MKLDKFAYLALASLAFAACDMEDIVPQGGTLLATQVQETNLAAPSRAEATFSGMFTKLGQPLSVFGSNRPDDFGFIMMCYSNDLEAADIVTANSNYNWFSTCGELTSRNADYANPYVRYAAAYNEIAAANDIIKSFPADTEDPAAINKMAQARAIRAFSYLNLAPYFQFSYAAGAQDKPCVPIVTETTEDFTNNPRATVAEVYAFILEDLNYAVEKLEGYTRPDKGKIDQQVAYGLRARAYLNMQMWAEAAADAEKAAAGYTPASMEEVSHPFLKDINEHNWIWGYDMSETTAAIFPYATSTSWIRPFTNYGYAAGSQVYACCNNLLYNKISSTDVRKGWWIDENLQSPLLEGLSWTNPANGETAHGQEISTFVTDDKMAYLPLTAVKFGCNTVGTDINDEDWPFMRVEEMILIQAEAHAKAGNEAKGRQILEDFVKTYRDPEYNSMISGRSFSDEVWFQRRVELWGEGFSNNDTRRLNKPLVRFHDGKSNFPEAFRFNMTADDGWWLLRFTTSELNTNLAIEDNTGGTQPVQDQNADLRDGVTD